MPRAECGSWHCWTAAPIVGEWWRRGGSNDTRLLILRNLLQTYERKNRTTRCMPASYVQNHVQNFEGRVSRRPLNAGCAPRLSVYLRDGNVLSGRSTRRG